MNNQSAGVSTAEKEVTARRCRRKQRSGARNRAMQADARQCKSGLDLTQVDSDNCKQLQRPAELEGRERHGGFVRTEGNDPVQKSGCETSKIAQISAALTVLSKSVAVSDCGRFVVSRM